MVPAPCGDAHAAARPADTPSSLTQPDRVSAHWRFPAGVGDGLWITFLSSQRYIAELRAQNLLLGGVGDAKSLAMAARREPPSLRRTQNKTDVFIRAIILPPKFKIIARGF